MDKIVCSNCNKELLSDSVVMCPTCGSNKKTFKVEITENITIRVGLITKGKRQGKGKPFLETIDMPDHSVKLNKPVHKLRVIDREKNHYHEIVSDYETGEIIHECKQALSEHIGHGTAKKKQ